MRYYLIIDNNPKTTAAIQKAFCAIVDYNCLGVVATFSQKLKRKIKFAPELVLINFDSIDSNPFKIINLINKSFGIPPNYIVMTVNFKKAFKAFKKGVFDVVASLEKPKQLNKAIQRYHEIQAAPKLLCIQYYHKFQYLYVNDILFLKADNYTTDFILKDRSTVNGFETLKQTHLQLPRHFQRVHRSYVINAYYVQQIDFGKREIKLFYLKSPIPFSKTYVRNVEKVKQFLIHSVD